ncbi:mitogen-activated protein kinase kinase kinase 20-related [Anaeramoeba flamelloides]|uniref:Mitogen-activated protein kinase kinase kinase 20-related n=1 Tax=Anaeramoeba flamelloides TaxID=1746091 RepID=A0ABQ8YC49_9EUKA|nr:mitogen-activated protein kinase kinase kinase 20-related [Anaeramoeba flamelloides]
MDIRTLNFLFFFFLILTQTGAISSVNEEAEPLFMKTSYLFTDTNQKSNNLNTHRMREDGSFVSFTSKFEQQIDSTSITISLTNHLNSTGYHLVGERKNVEKDRNTVGKVLVDPLTYSSFFAGSKNDQITTFSIGLDTDSYTIIIAGTTNSPDFPLKNNVRIIAPPDEQSQQHTLIAFVSRIDSSGNIIFSTYFGGSISQNEKFNRTRSIKAESTTTEDIPITVNSFNRATFDVMEVGFILCLSGNGDSIHYSSLFGDCEKNITRLLSIEPLITDRDKFILVGGFTNSSNKVYRNELQSRNDTISTIYAYVGLLRILSDETELVFGSIFGGTEYDAVESTTTYYQDLTKIMLWVSGTTSSKDFFDYYSKETSPDAYIINKNFEGEGTMAFFLQIEIKIQANHTFTAKLTSGSLIGNSLDDRSHWIQRNLLLEYNNIYIGPMAIVGDTKNFDNFMDDNNTVKPNWMKNQANNNNSLVGFFTLVNEMGTRFNYSFLAGCYNGNTSFTYSFFTQKNFLAITGWTNCNSTDFPITTSIWKNITNGKDPLNVFQYKYFVMSLDLNKLNHFINSGSNNNNMENDFSYNDFILYSTFVDGTNHPDLSGKYAAVKVDMDGNVYSAFNVKGKEYQNKQFTENAFLIQSIGESSILLRIYGGFFCNPGSYYDQVTQMCIFCQTGHYSENENSLECTACLPGYYQNKIGSTGCLKCKKNEYSNSGQTTCSKKDIPKQLKIGCYERTSKSLSVYWDYQKEQELNYLLSLKGAIGHEMIYLVPSPKKIKHNDQYYYSFIITGLLPSFRYYIRVKSQNSSFVKQFSSWSSELVAETYGTPNRVHDQDISCKCTPNSLNLTWPEVPNYSNSPLIYHVYYRLANDTDSIWQIIKENEPKSTITDLGNHEQIEIQISAINDAGEGFKSAPRQFSTCSIIPEIVQIIKYSATSNEFTFSWKCPFNGGDNIVDYKYRFKSWEENTYKNIGLAEKYTIKHLKSSKTYYISINAQNGIGLSKDYYYSFKTDYKFSDIYVIILSVVGSLAVITGATLWITRTKIIKRNQQNKIKKLISKDKKAFFKKFHRELYCTEETLSFDSLNIDSLLETVENQIRIEHCINIKNNWVVLNKDTKNGLIFCKLAQLNETQIHQKIWEKFGNDPSNIPVLKMYGYQIVENIHFDIEKKKDIPVIKKSDSKEPLLQNYKNNANYTINNSNGSDYDFGSGSSSSHVVRLEDSDSNFENNDNNNKSPKLLFTLEWLPISLHEYNLYRKSESKPFSEKEKLWISFNLIHSLQFIHQRRIIHRDIKPQNVMIGMDGYLRIIDFSSAVGIRDGSQIVLDKLVGTKEYFDNFSRPNLHTETGIAEYQYSYSHDVYSLGKTLEKINWEVKGLNTLNRIDQKNGLKSHLLVKQKKNRELVTEFQQPVIEIIKMSTLDLTQRSNLQELIDFIDPYVFRFILGQK